MLKHLITDKQMRNSLIFLLVWIPFSLMYWEYTSTYLSMVKSYYLNSVGNIGGHLLFTIFCILFFVPSIAYCSLKSLPILFKLDYLILLEKSVLLKILHEFVAIIIKCMLVILLTSFIIMVLKAFNVEYIQNLFNDLSLSNLLPINGSLVSLMDKSILYELVALIPSVFALTFTAIAHEILLLIKVSPLLSIIIITIVVCNRIHTLLTKNIDDEELNLLINLDKNEQVDLEQLNSKIEDDNNFIIKIFGSKKVFIKSLEKIRELRMLKARK